MIRLFYILLIFTAAGIRAQQLPLYTQYMLNDYVMNPAIAGKNPYYEVKSNNRYQWIGITDAPRTYILSANGPTRDKNVGLGGYLFTDIVGPTRRIGIDFTYAYHIQLAEKTKLSFGASAGLLQWAVDGSKITLYHPFDNIISNGYQSVLVPNLGAGFYFYGEKWYVGGSAPQVYPAKLKFFSYQSDPESRMQTHFYGSAGYSFDLGEDFDLEPSILLKYVKPVPLQFDGGIRLVYKESVWAGATYRTMDAWAAFVGFNYEKNLTLGYSYDFTTTNLKNYSSGTHELIIAIRFGHRELKNDQKSRIQ
ncbi:MAG: type IX secretion system membrane protein PorP/SprF [Bacteroidia bacterium]|nr:type IX secretion system membrane protein PorP/SprF [Bacteroidia bacterium]